METQTPEELLEMVKKFAKMQRKNKQKCNYHDYEYYKSMFISRGYYGYESRIADILRV